VIASHDDGWYLVQNAHGAFGVVPGNYLFVTPKVSPPFRSFQRHAEEYHWNAQGCSAQKYNDAYCDSSPPLHTHEIPRIRHARTHHLRLLLSPYSLSLSLLAHSLAIWPSAEHNNPFSFAWQQRRKHGTCSQGGGWERGAAGDRKILFLSPWIE